MVTGCIPPGDGDIRQPGRAQGAESGARVFGILLERKTVLEGYESLRAGFTTPQVKSFDVEVGDGFLDLDFLAEEAEPPTLSGLSLERRS